MTNTGDVTLSHIAVSDDILGSINSDLTLIAGQTVTLDKDYTVPVGHSADVVNIGTACVSGAPGLGEVPLCTHSTHTLDVLHPAIHLVKTAAPTTITAGGSVTYSYAVTNPGDIALSGVSVSDDKCSPVAFSGGDTDHDNLLDPGENWTYTCSATLAVDTLNTATAQGTPPVGPDVTDTDTALVDVVNPLLHIDKKGPAQAHEGDTVTYTFTVTNTGDVTLADLSVVDDVLGPIGTIRTLAAGDSVDLTKTYTIPAHQITDVVNTVLVCTAGPAPGTGEDGGPLCDTDVHVLDVLHPALTIHKTANPTSVAGSGPVTYTYVITNTGDALLHGVVVSDDIIGAIGTVASLAPGASTTLTKTVVVDAKTPPTNIGTVVGTDILGKTVTATRHGDDHRRPGRRDRPTPGPAHGAPATASPAVLPLTELPRTGAPLGTEGRAGIIMLQAGLALWFFGRRRRHGDPLAGLTFPPTRVHLASPGPRPGTPAFPGAPVLCTSDTRGRGVRACTPGRCGGPRRAAGWRGRPGRGRRRGAGR